MSEKFPDRTNPVDENRWLEEIHGEHALDWVSQQNAKTMASFDGQRLAATEESMLAVYDSDDRIPFVTKYGDWYYNFWKDVDHPRGIWRRTDLEGFRTGKPTWDVVLDIDALGASEGRSWVFQGADFCAPDNRRALLRLSPDGGDAVEIREFDVETKQIVDDGFMVPYAKSHTAWINLDTVLVATDFGEGSLTTSGYAREARRWTRGQALEDASHVHAVATTHMTIGIAHDSTPGFERTIVLDKIDFFNGRYYLAIDDQLHLIEVPTDATIDLHREWLTISVKSDWVIDDKTYLSGSLIAIHFDEFMSGRRDFQIVFEPTKSKALLNSSWTQNYLLLNLLEDVSTRLVIASPNKSGWTYADVETPELQNSSAWPVDEDESDDYWLTSTGFLQQPMLSLGSAASKSIPDPIWSQKALFDADRYVVEQHFATSTDGTRVPYFQVGPRESITDGMAPTLLTGYGGFQISRLPEYDATIGREWLDRGGVYVVANIRGGGEYGPDWHTCALRENRHRAYEDFAAVAKDLVSRGVTSAERLGCMGGSNGGLLVGNMLTHYPELFGGIVCTVPLLDMQRYIHLSAGASWIAEYGNPDQPADWDFIQTFSPYHNLREDVSYPPVLFYTATSDDRVGPVQARKMAERMQKRGISDVWFYENQQGGHAGSASNIERARMRAMSLEFLHNHLH